MRKKLKKGRINPNVITPLGVDAKKENEIFLRVNYIENLDEKHETFKMTKSKKEIEKIGDKRFAPSSSTEKDDSCESDNFDDKIIIDENSSHENDYDNEMFD